MSHPAGLKRGGGKKSGHWRDVSSSHEFIGIDLLCAEKTCSTCNTLSALQRVGRMKSLSPPIRSAKFESRQRGESLKASLPCVAACVGLLCVVVRCLVIMGCERATSSPAFPDQVLRQALAPAAAATIVDAPVPPMATTADKSQAA